MTCWLAQFSNSGCMYRPDGQPDPCHLIEAQRIRRAGITDRESLWDKRIIVASCRHHHNLFDRKFFHLTLADYPQSVLDWASEHGFEWFGERAGWRAEA